MVYNVRLIIGRWCNQGVYCKLPGAILVQPAFGNLSLIYFCHQLTASAVIKMIMSFNVFNFFNLILFDLETIIDKVVWNFIAALKNLHTTERN